MGERARRVASSVQRVEIGVLAAGAGSLTAFGLENLASDAFYGRLPWAFESLGLYLFFGMSVGVLAVLMVESSRTFRPRARSWHELAGVGFSCAFAAPGLATLSLFLRALPAPSAWFSSSASDLSSPGWIFFLLGFCWAAALFAVERLSKLRLPILIGSLGSVVAVVATWRGFQAASSREGLIGIGCGVVALAAIGAFSRERPRRFVALVASLALLVWIGTKRWPEWRSSATSPAPNLVFIVVDTLRADTFRSVVEETPEGSRFREAMAGSVWFEQAVAAAPWTVPSMGSIMTGLYPDEHGFVSSSTTAEALIHPLSQDVETLAERLAWHGFRTEALISNPILRGGSSGMDRGFDHYSLLTGPPSRLPFLQALRKFGEVQPDYYQSADIVRWRFLRRLDGLADSQPFFMWLHLMDPHLPLKAHAELEPEKNTIEPELAGYRLEVRFALWQVALMLEDLAAHGVLEETAVVVVSDHGEMMLADARNERSLLRPHGHGHALYDELTRVPLVIKPPWRLPADRHVDALVSHVDLHDTVLDLLGVGAPRIERDRRSLLPWLRPRFDGERDGPSVPGRSWAYSGSVQLGPPQHAIYFDGQKMIQRDLGAGLELYNLRSDPEEKRDLSAAEVGDLDRLRSHLATVRDQMRSAEQTAPMELDEDSREQLKALGYIGG